MIFSILAVVLIYFNLSYKYINLWMILEMFVLFQLSLMAQIRGLIAPTDLDDFDSMAVQQGTELNGGVCWA